MSGAAYGYRYIRKTDDSPASYAVIDAEARVIQRIYDMYTVEGLSIGAITRRLNEERIPTRKRSARLERSTVWGGLAQFCVPRRSLLWKKPRSATQPRHTAAATARRDVQA